MKWDHWQSCFVGGVLGNGVVEIWLTILASNTQPYLIRSANLPLDTKSNFRDAAINTLRLSQTYSPVP